MSAVLNRRQFGDPILRKVAKQIVPEKITSKTIQNLISDMRYTLRRKKLGVGLAAPQVGKSLALAVISVRPTELRPEVCKFDKVLINPKILSKEGKPKQLWEGCISAGSSGKADLFAKVPRFTSVTVRYYDEAGKQHTNTFTGLAAQIVQHEVDHLNGILFVDRVTNTKTYMTYEKYTERVKKLAN